MGPEQQIDEKWQFLRAIFDVIPLPLFVMDSDMRILDHNAAGSKLCGTDGVSVLRRRGGEAFQCINSSPLGCGHSEFCSDCLLRESVRQAFAGKVVRRQPHKAEVQDGNGSSLHAIDLLVTCALLPDTEPPRVASS